ncbi:MAG: gliding motility-associated C-terminal domain-containing protein [Bacteroidia bacterium]|nr:gliding motility-associated C-terminal domain-containing protein [Bacteroidia bacterium]
MLIFDRWGEKVFETTVFNSETHESEGWDGHIKDRRQPPVNGTYTWLVIFFDNKGTRHEAAGAVTVIR